MVNEKLTEEEAYQTIRREAMSKRMAIEEIAATIIDAHQGVKSGLEGT